MGLGRVIAYSFMRYYHLLEDPGYTQGGADIPPGTGMFDHEVPPHRRLNASYVLQSCNAAGCADSAPVGGTESCMRDLHLASTRRKALRH